MRENKAKKFDFSVDEVYNGIVSVKKAGIGKSRSMEVLFVLKSNISDVVSRRIGVTSEEVLMMSLEDELTYVRKKIGKPLVFLRARDPRKAGRGNPLLSKGRIRTMEDVDRKIEHLRK